MSDKENDIMTSEVMEALEEAAMNFRIYRYTGAAMDDKVLDQIKEALRHSQERIKELGIRAALKEGGK